MIWGWLRMVTGVIRSDCYIQSVPRMSDIYETQDSESSFFGFHKMK